MLLAIILFRVIATILVLEINVSNLYMPIVKKTLSRTPIALLMLVLLLLDDCKGVSGVGAQTLS